MNAQEILAVMDVEIASLGWEEMRKARTAVAALIAERDALQATVIRLHVARELLTNIKRACAHGRNSAAPTKVNNSFIATCDHVENLANEALAALTTGESA